MSYFFIESQTTNLIKYQIPFDINIFKSEHVVFSGVLGIHPNDTNKVVLISDPHNNNTRYFEFERADIGLIEKQPNLISSDGEDFAMVLLWIKAGSVATQSSVFIV